MTWFAILKSPFYHVTTKDNANNIIREEKMHKGRGRGSFGQSAIWLWSKYSDAYEYLIDSKGRGTREELLDMPTDKVIMEIVPDEGFTFTKGRMQVVTYTGMSNAPTTKLESVMIYNGDKDLTGKFTIV